MNRIIGYFGSVALALGGLAAAAQDDPDRKKTASALFSEGLRAETEPPADLSRALMKYKKAVDRAAAELQDPKVDEEGKKAIRAVAASALVRTGFASEKLEPENVADAQASYGRVASEYGEVDKWGALAKEKVSLKGVDVYLARLHASLLPWRDTPDRSTLALTERKAATWEKIKGLNKDAIYGLVWGLGHSDEVIRDFAAVSLAEVVDNEGIATVIAKLNDPRADMRSGAALALQKIYKKYNEAAEYDRAGDELLRDLQIPTEADTKLAAIRDALRDKASAFGKGRKEIAAQIRINIPESLNTPEIQSALEKIIGDESAQPQARLEAAQAAGGIGRISGPLVDAILKAMVSPDRNVRQGACRAAGSVDTAIAADKMKIVGVLVESVSYEPAKPRTETHKPPAGAKDDPDWANDEVVRQASAEALERIAIIKCLPPLIEALDDNDARVRHSAHRALRQITWKDFGYESDKPLKERLEGQAKWQAWWTATSGVVVLVERFWRFQAQWKDYPAVKLFDPALFLKEIESRQWAERDPKAVMDRAQRVLDTFQKLKDVFVQDAVDAGPETFDLFLKFIGGETDLEPKANAPTRSFVAECCARIIKDHNLNDKVAALRDTVISGDSPAKKTGAAIALGFLPREKIGVSEREALQVRGLSAGEAEVREASANALARVGEEAGGPDLTKAAMDAEVAVQIAALRAIALIKPKGDDTIQALGTLTADEPDPAAGVPSKKSVNAMVREHAVIALGEIGNPAAMAHLIRSRRDPMINVQKAAEQAVQKVHKAAPKEAGEAALMICKDEKRKTDDRIGAALALGDMRSGLLANALANRLVDPQAPRFLKDQDPEVRFKICQALGIAAMKTKTVVEKLIFSMGDENERETVRDAAYQALKAVTGADAAPFKASDTKPQRDQAGKAWRDWFKTEEPNLKDEL